VRVSVVRKAMFAVVVLTGLWAAWNGVGFALDSATRHRAEAAWFIFAAALVVAGLTTGRRPLPSPPNPGPAGSVVRTAAPLILVAGALILYAPVLGVGLLSDDFVLLQRARDGVLIDRSWEYVRPLPLAVWRAVDAALPSGAVPAALHALNAALHGLNAWLVMRCAAGLQQSSRVAWSAALLFLAAPFAVEAVTWASGIFDLMLVLLVLIAAAVLLSERLPLTRRVAVIALLTALAAASKETAVAQPLLLALLIPFVRREQRRAAWWSTIAASIVIVLYVGWRLSAGITAAPLLPDSGYALKEMLSRPFGAVAFGVHHQVLDAVPLLAVALAVAWPMIWITAAWKWLREPGMFTIMLLGAAWLLISTLPLLSMFFVGDDLQGSRYLYLGSTVWSIAVVVAIAGSQPRTATTSTAALAVMIVVAVAIVVAHQGPWRQAAATRDRVLEALEGLPANCTVRTDDLPDTEAGAYVFRNGFREAEALVRAAPAGTTSPCVARWRGTAFEVRE
jgi:hypothetical protein